MNTLSPSVLGTHPLLRGLAGPHLARLAGHARAVTLPDRHRLFEEGQPASRFWLVEAGQVALDTIVPGHGRMVIELLGRGEVVGLSWLLPPYRWGFGAITTQPVRAFEFDAAAIRAAYLQDPAFGHEMTDRFLRVTLHRLQATRQRLLDVSAHPDLVP
jgi:CRP/FNR family transcriptional regulator, cyclic AMP receptor protein